MSPSGNQFVRHIKGIRVLIFKTLNPLKMLLGIFCLFVTSSEYGRSTIYLAHGKSSKINVEGDMFLFIDSINYDTFNLRISSNNTSRRSELRTNAFRLQKGEYHLENIGLASVRVSLWHLPQGFCSIQSLFFKTPSEISIKAQSYIDNPLCLFEPNHDMMSRLALSVRSNDPLKDVSIVKGFNQSTPEEIRINQGIIETLLEMDQEFFVRVEPKKEANTLVALKFWGKRTWVQTNKCEVDYIDDLIDGTIYSPSIINCQIESTCPKPRVKKFSFIIGISACTILVVFAGAAVPFIMYHDKQKEPESHE